ncbi:MAG: hypothetical protein ACR2ML_09540 [Solirubrobacteraceae bacterium]
MAALAATAASVVVLAACGEDDDYKSCLRPPSTVNVSAAITESSVSLSPPQLGAGPIVMIVTNQSGASQVATLEADELASKPGRGQGSTTSAEGCPPAQEPRGGLRQSTGPINPQDTAQLKVVVQQNRTYTLKTDDDAISPGRLQVTKERGSAQSKVLQP